MTPCPDRKTFCDRFASCTTVAEKILTHCVWPLGTIFPSQNINNIVVIVDINISDLKSHYIFWGWGGGGRNALQYSSETDCNQRNGNNLVNITVIRHSKR